MGVKDRCSGVRLNNGSAWYGSRRLLASPRLRRHNANLAVVGAIVAAEISSMAEHAVLGFRFFGCDWHELRTPAEQDRDS